MPSFTILRYLSSTVCIQQYRNHCLGKKIHAAPKLNDDNTNSVVVKEGINQADFLILSIYPWGIYIMGTGRDAGYERFKTL